MPSPRAALSSDRMLSLRNAVSAVARRRLIIACVIALSIAVVGAIAWLTHQPARGISEERAIQLAWKHVDNNAVAVTSGELRQDFHTGFDIPVHHWAWVVTFVGQWHLLCQGSGAGCDPTSEWVAIDYYTGDWIASQYSYPAGH